jgi:hypothetical protein
MSVKGKEGKEWEDLRKKRREERGFEDGNKKK